jgi:hypothetical protein
MDMMGPEDIREIHNVNSCFETSKKKKDRESASTRLGDCMCMIHCSKRTGAVITAMYGKAMHVPSSSWNQTVHKYELDYYEADICVLNIGLSPIDSVIVTLCAVKNTDLPSYFFAYFRSMQAQAWDRSVSNVL